MESKLQNTSAAQNKRSSKEIKQDLAVKGEDFSRTVEQLGERIEEKLDWRGHLRESPFWTMGAATGLGFLAAALVRRRTTPMERLLKTLNSGVSGGLSGIAGPGLIKLTLLGIAARTASHWLSNTASFTTADSDDDHPSDPTGDDGTSSPADKDK